jgi:hypothetical protein
VNLSKGNTFFTLLAVIFSCATWIFTMLIFDVVTKKYNEVRIIREVIQPTPDPSAPAINPIYDIKAKTASPSSRPR